MPAWSPKLLATSFVCVADNTSAGREGKHYGVTRDLSVTQEAHLAVSWFRWGSRIGRVEKASPRFCMTAAHWSGIVSRLTTWSARWR
jgi:hypothetical protein